VRANIAIYSNSELCYSQLSAFLASLHITSDNDKRYDYELCERRDEMSHSDKCTVSIPSHRRRLFTSLARV